MAHALPGNGAAPSTALVHVLKRCSDGKFQRLPQDAKGFLVMGRQHTADGDGRVSTNHCMLQREVDSAHAKKRYSDKARVGNSWELRFMSGSKDR